MINVRFGPNVWFNFQWIWYVVVHCLISLVISRHRHLSSIFLTLSLTASKISPTKFLLSLLGSWKYGIIYLRRATGFSRFDSSSGRWKLKVDCSLIPLFTIRFDMLSAERLCLIHFSWSHGSSVLELMFKLKSCIWSSFYHACQLFPQASVKLNEMSAHILIRLH